MAEIEFPMPIGIGSAKVALINLPVENIVGKLLRINSEPILAGELVTWCLKQVLDDQYARGDAAGAWSKRYPEYVRDLYKKEIPPPDVSSRESITISGEVAAALIQYVKEFPNENIEKAIYQRLNLLTDYLKRHYDAESGGFGPAKRRRYRGPREISGHIRHTAWAINSLWHIGLQDPEIDKIFSTAARRIGSKIQSE